MKNFRYYKAIEEHTQWLESNKKYGKQLVLENEDLSFLSIVDTNLNESIIKNCNLQRVVFDNVSLDMTYFYGNNFLYANISNSNVNNSIFKKNAFEGTTFENLEYKYTHFLNNIFQKTTFKNIKHNDSHFELNNFKINTFNNVYFNNTSVLKDNYTYCDFQNTSFLSHFVDLSTITNSHFYTCILHNSYINFKEETNNSYFQTEPKEFFTDYENKYPEFYMERLLKHIISRFETFETKFSYYKYDDSNYNEYMIQIRNKMINNQIILEQFKYQIEWLEHRDEKYRDKLKTVKEKISYIETSVKNSIVMLSGLEKTGDEK